MAISGTSGSEDSRNFKNWWRRRELNSDPKTNAEGLYMLIRFSFLSGEPDKNSLDAESVKRQDLDTS